MRALSTLTRPTGEQITPESGKVYMDAETNITYRWSGHSYAPIGSDLALGETQSTAYRGDRGKIAYDHSMTKAGNPHGTKAADIGYTDNKGLGAKKLAGGHGRSRAKSNRRAEVCGRGAGRHHKNWAHHRRCAQPERNTDLHRQRAKPDLEQLQPGDHDHGRRDQGTDAGSYNATFTPKEGYTWGDGTNETKTVVWKIGRATIMAVPSQSGALAYTGSAQTPAWANYESTKLTLGGTTSGTNAGSYEATFTPKANYQWQDGSTTAKTAVWRIERAKIAVVPSQSGALTYTGGAQSPSWSNYDSAKLTLGGTTSGTAAGNYNATFTPKENYQWQDGSVAAKKCGVGHSKGGRHAGPYPPTSMTLDASAKSKNITVTKNGTGAVSATASPSGVVTVSVSGNTVTVTAVKDGNATVTVNVAADANHTAPSAKTCSVKVEMPNIYGVEWDGTSTTVWSRTDKAAGFTNPVPYVAGQSKYGSPFDNLMPWAGWFGQATPQRASWWLSRNSGSSGQRAGAG